MARITFEHEVFTSDLAETLVNELTDHDLLLFLKQISAAKNDEEFDKGAANLFTNIAEDWS